jgi:hypothetical protein
MYVQQCGMKQQVKWFNYLNQYFGIEKEGKQID